MVVGSVPGWSLASFFASRPRPASLARLGPELASLASWLRLKDRALPRGGRFGTLRPEVPGRRRRPAASGLASRIGAWRRPAASGGDVRETATCVQRRPAASGARPAPAGVRRPSGTGPAASVARPGHVRAASRPPRPPAPGAKFRTGPFGYERRIPR